LTEKLRQAEQELDAARIRTALNEAASKFQRAKAELKALEQLANPQRRTSRGSKSAGASA